MKDFDPRCVERQAPGGDPCIFFRHITLDCPAANDRPNIEVVKQEGEYPLIRCRVCGMNVESDTNPLGGRWSGRVAWGPNQFDAMISETSIDSYRVYVADEKLVKLGESFARVEAKQWANLFKPAECNPSYYEAYLDISLPSGAVYFMVVPFTRGGLELNVGPVVPVEDLAISFPSRAARFGIDRWLVRLLLLALALAQASFL